MTRLNKFESFKNHLMLSKSWNKLKLDELERCREFIRENEALDWNEFAAKTNRWMLDEPKPKRYSDMWALVLQSNVKE